MRWRDLASQVQPPLTEKEFCQLFINTLKNPYYEKLLCCPSFRFPEMIVLGDQIEEGLRMGRIPSTTTEPQKKVTTKKGEVQQVSLSPWIPAL